MADIKAANYDSMPVADRSGQIVKGRKLWPVTVQTNADKVHIGFLPADHRFNKTLSSVIADGATPGFTYSLILDNMDGTTVTLISAQAVTASTFAKTAIGATDAVVEGIGKKPINRDIYLLLSAAPATAGGNVYVEAAYEG